MNNVEIVEGDLFESECEALTNAVNCVGVMGAGIALGFAERFPEMLKDYEADCAAYLYSVGVPRLWKNQDGPDVINFPTMYHPGEEADLETILIGLELLVKMYEFEKWTMRSIAIPALGCGIGGLLFDEVGPEFIKRLEGFDVPVELYRPNERALGNPYGGPLSVSIEDLVKE